MNECIFFGHILFVLLFLWLSLRKGKEALFIFVTLQALFANLFVVKQMTLFGWEVTCSDVYAVGALFGLNFLREIYGPKEAKRAIFFSFLSLLFFVAMTKMHLFYLPNTFDTTQDAFKKIFSSTPRIVIASLIVFYFMQQIDLLFYGWLKRIAKTTLFLRMGGSLLFSQLLDTILFTFLGLYGVVASWVDVILVSFMIKALVILVSSLTLPFFKTFLQKVEE